MGNEFEAPDQQYDLFVSYRRKDGFPFANWLRQRLIAYRLPKALGERSQRRLRIFQDTTYERATEDFWRQTIEPALMSSRYLGVVVTPGVFEAREDTQSNWVEREIATFSGGHQGKNIFVLQADAGTEGTLPGGLHQKLPYVERIDIRHARYPWTRLRYWRLLRDRLLTIAATLYDIVPEEMPVLRREEERRRRRFVWSTMLAGLGLLTIVSGFAVAWWTQRGQTRLQSQRAVEQTNIARQQKRSAAARRLASEATALQTSDNGLALQLGVAAVEIEANPQALGALLATLEANPQMAAGYIGGANRITTLEASPAGSLVALGDNRGTVTLWDIASIKSSSETQARNQADVTACRFDATGKRVAIGDAKGGVRIFDSATGRTTDLDATPPWPAKKIAFSPNGAQVAAAFSSRDDKTRIGIWDAQSGKLLTLVGQSESFTDIEDLFLRRDGTLGAFDWGNLKLFSGKTGALIETKGHGKFPRPGPSAYSRDGTLAVESGLDTGYVFVFEPLNPDKQLAEINLKSRSFIDIIAFNPNNSLVAAAQDRMLKIFTSRGQPVQTIDGLGGEAESITFSADSERLAALVNGRVQVWARHSVSRLARSIQREADVPSVIQGVVGAAFNPKGTRMAWIAPEAGSGSFGINIWDAGTAGVSRLPLGSQVPLELAFVDDSTIAYTQDSSSRPVAIDARTGKTRPFDCGGLLPGPDWSAVKGKNLVFQRCLAGAAGATDTRSLGEALLAAGLQPKRVMTSALSADTTRLAFVDEQMKLTVVDTRQHSWKALELTGLERNSSGGYQAPELTLSPNGHRMVLKYGGTTFGVYDVDALARTGTWTGVASQTVSASNGFTFSPDGKWLVFEMGNGVLDVWDPETLTLIGQLHGDGNSPYRRLAFDPNGRQMAEVVSGGGVTLWDLDLSSWRRKACAAAGRSLSEQERLQHIPENGDLYQIEVCK